MNRRELTLACPLSPSLPLVHAVASSLRRLPTISMSVAALDAVIASVKAIPAASASASAGKSIVPTETKDVRWWPIIPPGHTPYTWYGVGSDSAEPQHAAKASAAPAKAASAAAASSSSSSSAAPAASAAAPKEPKAPKEKAAAKPAKAPAAAASAADAAPDQPEYTKLDIRVGQIVKASRHPDPTVESLYVEEIDVGEGAPRVIVSGLVKFIPLDVFSTARVCVICNLKPSPLKGVVSNGMVLAASNGDKTVVELIVPPAGSKPGDRILPIDGEVDYSSFAPLAVVDPKAKKNNAWVATAESLKTNDAMEATWDGKRLGTKAHGAAKAVTLAGAKIA